MNTDRFLASTLLFALGAGTAACNGGGDMTAAESGQAGSETTDPTDPTTMDPTTGADGGVGSTRFEDVLVDGRTALLDTATGLLWVNDVDACNPLGPPNADTLMLAMQHCDGLMFVGYEDWRIPSTEEASELITAALEENVDLVYQNPGCPAVIAMDGTAIQTHNGAMPGEVIDMPPSVGIRCVRMAP